MSEARILSWVPTIGALGRFGDFEEPLICIGSRPSRSKRSAVRLEFVSRADLRRPGPVQIFTPFPQDVWWAGSEAAEESREGWSAGRHNVRVLTEALVEAYHRKPGVVRADRGAYACRVFGGNEGTWLALYELAPRGTVWARYWTFCRHSDGMLNCLNGALLRELASEAPVLRECMGPVEQRMQVIPWRPEVGRDYERGWRPWNV